MADFDDTGDLPDDLDPDELDADLDADDLDVALDDDLDEDFDFGDALDDDALDDDELDDELAGLGLDELDEPTEDDDADADGAEASLDELAEADADADDPEDGELDGDPPATALVEDSDDLLDDLDADRVATRELDVDDEVREGEFVCRSCFMAKRESALADEENLLCRDCV